MIIMEMITMMMMMMMMATIMTTKYQYCLIKRQSKKSTDTWILRKKKLERIELNKNVLCNQSYRQAPHRRQIIGMTIKIYHRLYMKISQIHANILNFEPGKKKHYHHHHHLLSMEKTIQS